MSWEFTGNHYMALPFIDPEDGAVHGVNVLHRGMASLVSWSGDRQAGPGSVPLLRPRVSAAGEHGVPDAVRWERVDRWIPRMTAAVGGGVRVSLTYCTPGGFNPLVPGGVIQVQVEREMAEDPVRVWLEGHWAWTLRTAATTRPSLTANRVQMGPGPAVVLEAGEMPNGAALALMAAGPGAFASLGAAAGGDGFTLADEADGPASGGEAGNGAGGERQATNGQPLRFRLGCDLPAGSRRVMAAFVLGVGADRDGALAVAGRLARLGGEELIRLARLDLASLNRATEESAAREVVARNLVFHHYWAAARAIDDDRLYPVLSRSPEHGPCAVFGEREALAWSLPAYALTDPLVARELLMRMLEVYSDRPGNLRRYVDGSILDSGFSLGRALEYALAIERHAELTRDESIAGEPLAQQVLREADEGAFARLHPEIFLAGTEVLPGGEPADYAYCAWDNVLLWRLCRVIDRYLAVNGPEQRPRLGHADREVEAAFWQRFSTEVDGLRVIAYTSDLSDRAAVYDDPAGSLRLLPFLGFCEPDDPIWSNTMELLHSQAYPLFLGGRGHPGFAGRSAPTEARFSVLCADLLTPWRSTALEALRSLEMPGGVACSAWDPATGRATAGPYAASEAGFLVWAVLAGEAAAMAGGHPARENP